MSSETPCSAGYQPALREPAFGKLNLTLDVVSKRSDGYHDLRMVMCSVDLHDDISIELDTGEESCVCTPDLSVGTSRARPRTIEACPYIGTGCPPCHSEDRSDEESEKKLFAAAQNDKIGGIPQGADNLAFRAARAYFDAAGIDPGGFSIRIVKRIPMQAGMAGGSSDAAAVLRALNRHFGAFSGAELRDLGLTLGSDVPYCLFGGVALAEGRGERLTRLPDLPKGLTFVLVRPDFSVSTPVLFRALDAARTVGDDIPDAIGSRPAKRADSAAQYIGPCSARAVSNRTDAMVAALQSRGAAAIGRALSNDFTAVLARDYPVVEAVKTALLSQSALGAELTGTGSVLYGVFADPAAARSCAASLSSQFPFVTVTNAH